MFGLPESLLLFILAIFGLIVGSFLNVVIARVPAGESISSPGSRCPLCGHVLSPMENIPVLSWLILHGKCRNCKSQISLRYPLVELGSAGLWLVLGIWALHQTDSGGFFGLDFSPLLPLVLILGSAGVALALIDHDTMRLPNAIVYPLYPVTLIGLLLAGFASGRWELLNSLIGGSMWVILIGGIYLLSGGRAMGMGDVKLAPILGVTLGWIGVSTAALGLFFAFVTGAIFGLVLIATKRASSRGSVPFGPFLLVGALISFICGVNVWNWYTSSFGL